MTIRRATSADIPLILQLLRATPNPPNEDEDTIQSMLDDSAEFIFVDTAAPALCRIVLRPDTRPFVDMPWWTWRGSGDMNAKLLPVYAAVATAFVAEHGRAALDWPVAGQLSGAGADDAAKRTDADLRAGALQTMLKEGGPVNSVVMERALNGVDSYLQTTIGLLLERAERL